MKPLQYAIYQQELWTRIFDNVSHETLHLRHEPFSTWIFR
ncbi:hypothetical protein BAT_3852 [Bacillus pumilus ATCC 7061]|nr:hypothetical protein BAT_3852 [Bacillus pumilus ATCC 7061]